mgnify:CR=1 FL=1
MHYQREITQSEIQKKMDKFEEELNRRASMKQTPGETPAAPEDPQQGSDLDRKESYGREGYDT